MKKYFFAVVFISLNIFPLFARADLTKYSFDKEHTTILFFVNHLGFSEKIGKFTDYEGHFMFDEKNPKESSVELDIKPASIDTDSKALDKVLQGKDWFNTKKYPVMHFRSSQVKVTGKNTADVIGWLTLLGKEKPVTLKVKFNKAGIHPMTKKSMAGFSIDTTINRSNFGMINGVPFVSENVRIHVEMEGMAE